MEVLFSEKILNGTDSFVNDFLREEISEFPVAAVSRVEVVTAVERLKNNKSPGDLAVTKSCFI